MKLRIATLNVKGMAGPSKFSKTANLLKTYKDIDIIAIQETNINIENLQKTTKKWPKDSFWSPHVAILINNRKIQVKTVFSKSTRSMVMDFSLHDINYRIENIYVPPDRRRRRRFLEDWFPSDNGGNYILAGDYNLNLFPPNRLNNNLPKKDATKDAFQRRITHLQDTQMLATIPSMQTFSQVTAGNKIIANKIDYIHLSPRFTGVRVKLETRTGNSDHLLLLATLSGKSEYKDSTQWKLNTRILEIKEIREKATDELLNGKT